MQTENNNNVTVPQNMEIIKDTKDRFIEWIRSEIDEKHISSEFLPEDYPKQLDYLMGMLSEVMPGCDIYACENVEKIDLIRENLLSSKAYKEEKRYNGRRILAGTNALALYHRYIAERYTAWDRFEAVLVAEAYMDMQADSTGREAIVRQLCLNLRAYGEKRGRPVDAAYRDRRSVFPQIEHAANRITGGAIGRPTGERAVTEVCTLWQNDSAAYDALLKEAYQRMGLTDNRLRVPWDKYETAKLFEAAFVVEKDPASRRQILTELSQTLRSYGGSGGYEIDSRYRDITEIRFMIELMRYVITDGKKGVPARRTEMLEMCALYRDRRPEFNQLLAEANRLMGIETETDDSIEDPDEDAVAADEKNASDADTEKAMEALLAIMMSDKKEPETVETIEAPEPFSDKPKEVYNPRYTFLPAAGWRAMVYGGKVYEIKTKKELDHVKERLKDREAQLTETIDKLIAEREELAFYRSVLDAYRIVEVPKTEDVQD